LGAGERDPTVLTRYARVLRPLRLPEPMLARSARLPNRAGYAFEPKLDGFRALLSTERGFVVYSRRRWNMTPLVPELEAFPVRGTFDGELIAFGDEGPDLSR
jgi:ATP-dependent DNA ligase